MVWLEIPVWLPALGPVILNVCTLDFRSVHLSMGFHVFTEKRTEDKNPGFFRSVNYSLKRLTFQANESGRQRDRESFEVEGCRTSNGYPISLLLGFH